MAKKQVKTVIRTVMVEKKLSIGTLIAVALLTFAATFGSVLLGKVLGRTEASLGTSQQIITANQNVQRALKSGLYFGTKTGYKFGYHDAIVQAKKNLKARHK